MNLVSVMQLHSRQFTQLIKYDMHVTSRYFYNILQGFLSHTIYVQYLKPITT